MRLIWFVEPSKRARRSWAHSRADPLLCSGTTSPARAGIGNEERRIMCWNNTLVQVVAEMQKNETHAAATRVVPVVACDTRANFYCLSSMKNAKK